jgi:YidC/Oxa1 family membrane protein insertase
MSTEKRLFLFLALTFVVLAGYSALMELYGPKRPDQKDLGQQAGPQEVAKAPEKDKEPPADEPEKKSPEADPVADQPGAPPENKPENKPEDQPPVVHPHQVVSLGSYKPAKGASPLLVTVTSRGAGLERVELVERLGNGSLHYQDLDRHHGYFGNLSLTADSGGCRVHVVPNGTPAATAVSSAAAVGSGLQVGDLLISINQQPIEVPEDVDDELQRLRPGDSVTLSVGRKVGDQEQRIEFTATLDVRPFELIHPEPHDPSNLSANPPSLLLAVKNAEREQAPFLERLRDVEWETRVVDSGVEFHYTVSPDAAEEAGLSGPVEIIKRFRLGKPVADAAGNPSSTAAFHLDLEIELRNASSQPQSLAYRLDGTNGLPTEGWWYLTKIHPEWFQSAGARDVVLNTVSDGHRLIGCSKVFTRMKKDLKAPRTPLFSEQEPAANRTLAYIGIDTQYFCASLRPLGTQTPDGGVFPAQFARAEAMAWSIPEKMPKGWERTANTYYQLTSETLNVLPDQPFVQKFQLFLGPKDPPVLAAYGLDEWIYYGWFGWISRRLSGILHFFYAIVGNYGIAIILLTVLVRSCMFPISRTAARNAAMMQELAPEMRKIAEKHKNNLEARGKAQQELFRKNNYNPLSGCWLMFLQLPVFIGLYRCLAIDIELRQAPLIPGLNWCSNLAGPDKLFFWKTDFLSYFTNESGWLGPFFNVLPIITIVLFLLHQKLFTPPATDEQTAMQMKMMKFMTVFMGILFYKVPAGLCLYFITSSLWGIGERKLLGKPTQKKTVDGGDGGEGGFKLASLLQPRTPPPDDNGKGRKKELERKLRRNK